MRTYVAVLAAISAFFVVSASALATTISPTTDVTATATATDLTDTVSGVGVSCTGSSVKGTSLTSGGSLTIANGDATFSNCTSIIGNFTVTQLASWSGAISYNGGAPTLSVTVPGTGTGSQLKFELIGGGCTFWVAGSATSDPSASTSVSSITFTNQAGLNIEAVDPLNDCAGLINVNDTTSYNSSYTLDHTVTVSP